jgi:hypothetical protein
MGWRGFAWRAAAILCLGVPMGIRTLSSAPGVACLHPASVRHPVDGEGPIPSNARTRRKNQPSTRQFSRASDEERHATLSRSIRQYLGPSSFARIILLCGVVVLADDEPPTIPLPPPRDPTEPQQCTLVSILRQACSCLSQKPRG